MDSNLNNPMERREQLTYPEGCNEPPDARGEMDDIATGVINDAPLEQESSTPEAERAHGVAESEPERHEEHPRSEVHPAEEGAGEEDDGDGGKDELEVHHGGQGVQGRYGARFQGAILVEVHGGREYRLVEEDGVAEHRAAFPPEGQELVAERHLVAPHDPAEQHGSEGIERHEGGIDGPFLLHNAAVEDHEAWHRLQSYQRAGCELPCIVSLVEPVGYDAARVVVRRWDRHR